MTPAAAPRHRARRSRRRPAVVAGATTLGDCLAAIRLLASRQLVDGDGIERYERAFAQRTGRTHGIAFAAARVGLYGLLRALGVGPGHEVLVPVPTHVVVANAVRYTGASPVFVDCDPVTYGMDLEDARRKTTAATRVLLLQHTFGIPCDVEAALRFAAEARLELIEDCVHALGARSGGRPVGGAGAAGVFSTEETKTISTTMGGMVVTDREDLAARLRAFQAQCERPPASLVARYVLKLVVFHLLTQPHVHRPVRELYIRLGRRSPLPYATAHAETRGARPPHYERRFSHAQAVLGLRQLERLDRNVAHRRAVARVYAEAFARAGVAPLELADGSEPALLRYPFRVQDRERVLEQLATDLPLGTWFTSVLEEAASPAAGGYEPGTCPRAERAAAELLNLPTHPRVTLADAEHAVARLVSAGAVGTVPRLQADGP